MREMPKPPIKIVRLLGQLIVGNMFGVLIKMAFPEKEDELGPGIDFDLITLLLSPAGAALSVWVVGNVGREKGSIGWPLLAAYLPRKRKYWMASSCSIFVKPALHILQLRFFDCHNSKHGGFSLEI